MFRPVRISPPAAAPVQISAAKAFLRVDGADEDLLIMNLIAAAVDYLDGRTGVLGRCLVTQVWRYQSLQIPRRFHFDMPGASAATVTFRDSDGIEQVLAPDAFELVETVRGSCLVVSGDAPVTAWHGPFIMDVTFGTTAEEVPPALVQAIQMLVAHWYANREAVVTGGVTPLPLGVDMLIAPYRWLSI